MAARHAQGHVLHHLLTCSGFGSTHCHTLRHLPRPARTELWEAATEVFSSTTNGFGHRQTTMCLGAEEDAGTDDKTVLKMMAKWGSAPVTGARPPTAEKASAGRGPRRVRSRTYWSETSTRAAPAETQHRRNRAQGRRWQGLLSPTLDLCVKQVVVRYMSIQWITVNQKNALSYS